MPTQLPDETVRRLDEALANEQSLGRLPSVVAGLVHSGELAWSGASGTTGLPGGELATLATQYRIGSISKTFTAACVMRLRDEGAVDLSDRIGRHLPELEQLPVTVAQLLSHTSGLRAETDEPWWERVHGVPFAEMIATAARPEDLLCRPGRRFHYSNVGYGILGELASRLRGAPYFDVVRDELLEPLGMGRTTYRPEAPFAEGLAVHPHAVSVLSEPEHDHLAMAPAGQLWSTVGDLARWSEVLSGLHPEVLAADTVAEMAEPLGLADLPGQGWVSGYGLGLQLWNEGGVRRYGHSGGMPGHWSILLVDAASKNAVVVLANSTYAGSRPAFFGELLTMLAGSLPASSGAPFAGQGTQAPTGLAAELLGTWYWGPLPFRLNVGDDGRLELLGLNSPGRDTKFHPSPTGDGSFVGEWGYFAGEALRAHRGADGALSYFDVASFVFTRAPYEPASVIPGGVDELGWH